MTKSWCNLLSSARLRPMILNAAMMRIVALRTPHLKRASGLDATKWCKKECSLLRRSDTASGRMCSTFFWQKSWKKKNNHFHPASWFESTFTLADHIQDRSFSPLYLELTAHRLCRRRAALIISSFAEIVKDFPTVAYQRRSWKTLN